MSVVAVSPDGQRIAFGLSFPEAPPQIFVRPLGALTATPVAGGERGTDPFWSPDSRQIAFWGDRGGLKIVDPPAVRPGSCAGTPRRRQRTERAGVGVTSSSSRPWAGFPGCRPREANRSRWARSFLERPGGSGPSSCPTAATTCISLLRPARKIRASTRVRSGRTCESASWRRSIRPPIPLPANSSSSRTGSWSLSPSTRTGWRSRESRSQSSTKNVARFAGTTTAGRAHFSVSANGVLGWRPGPRGNVGQLTWFDRSGRKTGTVGDPGRVLRTGSFAGRKYGGGVPV